LFVLHGLSWGYFSSLGAYQVREHLVVSVINLLLMNMLLSGGLRIRMMGKNAF
jgi:hypothetical protein